MTEEYIAQLLALRFKYTPDQIANMNIHQQISMLNADVDPVQIVFDSIEEQMAYKRRMNG